MRFWDFHATLKIATTTTTTTLIILIIRLTKFSLTHPNNHSWLQLMLGLPLEMVHRWWRILLIYIRFHSYFFTLFEVLMCVNKFSSWPCLDKCLCFPRKARISILPNFSGVVAGSLTVSITDPNSYLAGASGGVYALIRYLIWSFNTSQFFLNNTLTCGVININININSFFPQTITTLFNTYVQRSLGERGGKLGWDGVCRSPPHHFHHPGWWAKTLRKAFLSLNDLWTKWLSLYHWTFAQFHFPSPKQYVFPGFFSPRPNTTHRPRHASVTLALFQALMLGSRFITDTQQR